MKLFNFFKKKEDNEELKKFKEYQKSGDSGEQHWGCDYEWVPLSSDPVEQTDFNNKLKDAGFSDEYIAMLKESGIKGILDFKHKEEQEKIDYTDILPFVNDPNKRFGDFSENYNKHLVESTHILQFDNINDFDKICKELHLYKKDKLYINGLGIIAYIDAEYKGEDYSNGHGTINVVFHHNNYNKEGGHQ